MARRILTKADVEAARSKGELTLGPDDFLTEAAREYANRIGLALREPGVAGAPATSAPSGGSSVGHAPLRDDALSGEGAIVTAIGRNRPHILAELTQRIADLNGNITDISQRLVQDYFSTILMVDLAEVGEFAQFKAEMEALSREGDYRVVVQHERIFRAMHRI
jgi:ACT domain-containing protein